MNTDIQAAIFDLGRVLVNIDNALLVEKLFTRLNTDDLQTLGHKTMSDPAMVEFNTGRIGFDAFYLQMCQTYGLSLTPDEFKRTWCDIFYTMEGMEQLVRQVADKVKVGLLSDTDPIHWNYIRMTWPWVGTIKNPTLSYEVGVMKPNAAIFETAAKNVNTDPRHCLFVDDLQDNVDGARAAGMQAVRFESVSKLEQQLKVMLNLGA